MTTKLIEIQEAGRTVFSIAIEFPEGVAKGAEAVARELRRVEWGPVALQATDAGCEHDHWPAEFSPCSEQDMIAVMRERVLLKGALEFIVETGGIFNFTAHVSTARATLELCNHKCLFEKTGSKVTP